MNNNNQPKIEKKNHGFNKNICFLKEFYFTLNKGNEW